MAYRKRHEKKEKKERKKKERKKERDVFLCMCDDEDDDEGKKQEAFDRVKISQKCPIFISSLTLPKERKKVSKLPKRH